MNRREFMVAASGVAVAAGAASVGPPVAAQDDEGGDGGDGDGGNTTDGGGDGNATEGGDGGGNESADDGGGGGGGTEEVVVGPGGATEFDPAELVIEPGTTVVWTWDSDTHNVVPDEIPEDAEWEGHEAIEDTGFEYEYTFEIEGEYSYVCEPHEQQGMVGSVIVQEGGRNAGGGAGAEEVDIHDLGVPIQKHWVGIASIFAIFTSLVFTFYLLKYGESAHTSSPGRR